MKTEILTVKEVANFLRLSEATIWRWCKTGKLSAFKAGHEWRVRSKDLEHFMEKQMKVHQDI